MDFELDDLLMDTVMGIPISELEAILSKVDEKETHIPYTQNQLNTRKNT